MPLPRVAVVAQALKRVQNFDCWIFHDELLHTDQSLPAGEVVEVTDPKGHVIGQAFYHPQAHIALRMLSITPEVCIDAAFLQARLEDAIAKRHALTGTTAKRLVFSEADGLPGLIVDQYGRYLVVQFRTAGMDRFREAVIDLLRRRLHPQGILERSDKEFRQEEGLPAVTQTLHGTVPARILIEEDDLRFLVDPHQGLKTGFYLDQRDARRRLRSTVASNQMVLDTFSYTGAFGVTAASRGAHVICLEQHEPFIELAKENARLNGVADRMEFIAGDAFYWLEAARGRPRRFDCVVLDPPSLAKRKADVSKGRRALHHLLVQALGLLPSRGRLILSLCTYHLLDVAEEIIRIAAAQVHARLRVREQWLQASDHPWMIQIPPTRYLTSWVLDAWALTGLQASGQPGQTTTGRGRAARPAA